MSCCLVTSWIASQSKLRVCASQQVCQPSQNYTGPRLCSESSLSPGNNNNGPDGVAAPNKTVKTKSDAGGRSETEPSATRTTRQKLLGCVHATGVDRLSARPRSAFTRTLGTSSRVQWGSKNPFLLLTEADDKTPSGLPQEFHSFRKSS